MKWTKTILAPKARKVTPITENTGVKILMMVLKQSRSLPAMMIARGRCMLEEPVDLGEQLLSHWSLAGVGW